MFGPNRFSVFATTEEPIPITLDGLKCTVRNGVGTTTLYPSCAFEGPLEPVTDRDIPVTLLGGHDYLTSLQFHFIACGISGLGWKLQCSIPTA